MGKALGVSDFDLKIHFQYQENQMSIIDKISVFFDK
jgi:hypothetical protein